MLTITDQQREVFLGLLNYYPNSRLTCRKAMTLAYFE